VSKYLRLCLSKYTPILSLVNGLWIFRNERSGVMFIKAKPMSLILVLFYVIGRYTACMFYYIVLIFFKAEVTQCLVVASSWTTWVPSGDPTPTIHMKPRCRQETVCDILFQGLAAFCMCNDFLGLHFLFLWCSMSLLLYGPVCHGDLNLDLHILFKTLFSLNISSIYIMFIMFTIYYRRLAS